VPWIHPKKTVVTVHGLEYEIVLQAYSFLARLYMRWSIKNSCRWARVIVSVSQNTKKDLIRLYKVPADKIEVIGEGYEINHVAPRRDEAVPRLYDATKPYLFFIGRLEERKNIVGIIKTFEILKERYNIPHKLVLAGKFGYGEEKIKAELQKTNCVRDIILLGYLNPEEKSQMLSQAEVFMFPTFYEGFGIPILEAQSVGTPVVTSNVSSMPEVTGDSALLVSPNNHEEIAEAVHKLISDKNVRDAIIEKGYENVKRFSWEKCAQEITEVLIR
jgi:glycosyltransferase involved in cell wall biosynthesis